MDFGGTERPMTGQSTSHPVMAAEVGQAGDALGSVSLPPLAGPFGTGTYLDERQDEAESEGGEFEDDVEDDLSEEEVMAILAEIEDLELSGDEAEE
eukprot:7530181-Pyramimonas_sp.AAC.1